MDKKKNIPTPEQRARWRANQERMTELVNRGLAELAAEKGVPFEPYAPGAPGNVERARQMLIDAQAKHDSGRAGETESR